GILRIADGLDRAHAQSVEDVRVRVRPDAVQFTAVADGEPRSDLRAARTKADLFEAAFRANTRIDWTSRPATARTAERVAR
ncbi:MAG: hypothetical protein HUU27_05305, partial [Phycisphaerae bacterium]|nr:hypothetical protein [Phycisphaerae bacterium]